MVVSRRSGLTRLGDRLERAGLPARERMAEDQCGAYAVLTGAGYRAIRRAWPVYARGIVAHVAAHLADDEARTLTELLGHVLSGEQTDDADGVDGAAE